MPTSAAGSNDAGFTLLELMVVVTLIGLLATAAALAIPDPRGRLLDEARRFAARADAARDEAIVTAAPVSVWITPGGYGFDRRVGGEWRPIGEKPFAVERWREGTRAETPLSGRRYRVTFDATGLADQPLDLRLTRDRASALVRAGAEGGVRVDAG